jgi:uncharacterized protein
MEFIVIGTERAGFTLTDSAENALNEEHWAYMDGFASQLVARGPILSHDGTEWAGSIHIIRTEDRPSAELFAFDEPYWRAGQYETVEVIGFENMLNSTMWERPRDLDCTTSWLARWELPEGSADLASIDMEEAHVDASLVFAGFLVADDGSAGQGFIAAIDSSPEEVDEIVARIARHCSLGTTPILDRWRRGGRPTE